LVVTITNNTPPNTPDISGPPKGTPGNQYLFNIVSLDAQNQDIHYYIDWGDNTTSDWLGPYVSGTVIHITHAWSEKGTYTIKAKAKDTFNAESDWGTIEIVMPLEVRLGSSYQQLIPSSLLGQHNIN
jgi:hypothetical protein